MKVLIIGGHPAPALALVDRLDEKNVLYVGRKHVLNTNQYSFEYKESEKRNIEFIDLNSAKIDRTSILKTVFYSYRIITAFVKSLEIIRSHRPDIIMSFGGYLAVPVSFAGFVLRVPVVTHEQTMGAGVANRLISVYSKKVCVSFRSSFKYFPHNKTTVTGNPLRSNIYKIKRQPKNLIYITGGSLGSNVINKIVYENLEFLLNHATVILQTGTHDAEYNFEKIEKKYLEINNPPHKLHLYKHVTSDKLSEFLADASMLIGRSGINTVSEIVYLNLPSILIPLVFGQKNEQLINAKFCKDKGVSEIIEQENYTIEVFQDLVKNMLDNLSKYKVNDSGLRTVFSEAPGNIINILEHEAQKN